jgi:histidyl-tRNA synthetase
VSGGRVDLPALGFGMGDVVLADLLAEKRLVPELSANIDAFVIIEDEAFREESLRLVEQLRQAGFCVEFPLVAAKSDKQFKRAVELKAVVVLRCQKKEDRLLCNIRNLRLQSQAEVVMEAAVENIARELGR